MPSACTKRPRNDDDPELSPDESFPSPPKRSHTKEALESRRSNKQPVNEEDDDDYTSTDPSSSDSSVDSSSEEEEEEDDDDDDNNNDNEEQEQEEKQEEDTSIASIQTRQRPRIRPVEKNNDILSRITSFLPQMKSANEDLERELAAGRGKEVQLDDTDDTDEGRYIEMNLGLGVLEEKRPGDEDYDPSRSDEDDNDEEMGQGQHATPETELPSRPKDSRVLGKLMGEKKGEAKKPIIEEMKD